VRSVRGRCAKCVPGRSPAPCDVPPAVKVAYAGTAPFAVLVLSHLLGSRHRVVVCVTTPDRPRGRHGRPQPSALKKAALDAGLRVVQPASLGEVVAQDGLLSVGADVLVACAYGVIVPSSLLDRLPALVVHPSLVPRWRGAAPVERALMAGESELGVATLRMTPGVDEGPVADMRRVHVPGDADAGQAYELLAAPAAASLVATLDGMEGGTVTWTPQSGAATMAVKLSDDDRLIDWSRPPQAIADQVRALSPRIGAVTELAGRRILVWRALAVEGSADADAGRLVVPCGTGALEILELQEAGRRRMTAAEYLRGAGRRLAQP